MAKLYFKVASDWEEVVKLRNEIVKLKQELKNIDSTQSPTTFKTLNTQLAASNQRLDELVTNAAKAGAEMEGSFKKKIFDASQTINGFTEKIIAQKSTIKGFEQDLRALQEEYRKITKNGGKNQNALDSIHRMKNIITEEKDALFTLTQQQAEARLSVKRLRDEYALYNDNAKKVVEKNNGIAISWKKALAVIGGTGILKALGSEMIRIRGEFQAADTAIQTLLGNKEKADTLMAQVREYAKISPLEFSDVTKATQMMLGFNIEAEKVPRYLQAIGDVSMGDTQRFNSLTLAFSQMSAAGKLMGQDLNQMINAGFNPLQIMSEKTGKSIATLKDEMSKGAISAEMVQQAFIDATSAGGKFYNMSENASKTINGQLSMMSDAIDSVFNEMGQKSEGAIMKGIQITTSLIENYETIGKVLVGLIATYGTYRTAVILVTAAESKHTLVEIGLTNARVLARKAQLALNAAMLTNPYVALATVVVGLSVAMWTMSDSTTAAARAQKEYNDIKEAASKREQEHKQKIEELLIAARDESLATLTRQKSLEELRKEYPKIFEKYDTEKLKLEDILKLKQQINEEDSRRSIQSKKENYSTLKQTVTNQQRYLQLFDNPDLRKNMSDADREIWKMFSGKQSYIQVREQMEKNSELLKKYQKDVLEDNIASYKANLKNYSKEKLEAELKLAQSSVSKRNGFAINGMMVKGGDLEGIVSSINSALAEKKPSTTYKEDYEKAKKDWEDAKKKLSEIEKDKSKFTSKQYEEAKKQEETAEKAYKDLGGITGSALSKQKKAADKQKKDQQKSAEELLSLRRQNLQAEIDLIEEGTEKKLKQIDLDYQKELDAIKKQEKDLSERQGGKLTSEQSIEISTRYTNAENKREKEIADISKELNSILDKYRDYSAQRIAIEKQYQDDEKKLRNGLAKAKSDSEKKQYEDALKELEKQRKKTIDSISKSEIEDSGIWKMLMGDVDALPTDTLEKLLSDAEQLVKTTNLSATDMKAMMDTINNARQNLIARNPFKTLKEEYEKYRKAVKKGDKQGASTSWSNVEQASEAIKNNISILGSSLASLGNTFSDELGEGIQKAVDVINDGITAFEVFGKTGEKSAGDTVKGISGIIGIITTLVGTVMNAFDSTKAEQERNIEYQRRQEGYWDSINYQVERYLELLKEAAGNDYFATATQSLTTLEKAREKAYKDIVKSMPVGDVDYTTFGLGQLFNTGKFASKMTEYAFGGPQAKEIFDFIQANGGYDLQNKLISEEAIWAMKSNADIWSKLPEWMQQAIDKFVEFNDQTKKLEETLNEDLFQTTSQSIEEAILEGLKSGKRGIADFGEDFEEIMRNALLQSFVIDQLRGKAHEFYKKYTLLADSDENGKLDLTAEEISDLRKDWNDIIRTATEKAKNIDAIVGGSSSSSQEASKKGFAAASQDSIDELNGRFTALQIAGEEIKNQNVVQSQSLNILIMKADTLLSINTEMRNIADDTRNLIANSYLELVQISENTGAIVKPIQQIQKDIAEVKNNTKGLSTK